MKVRNNGAKRQSNRAIIYARFSPRPDAATSESDKAQIAIMHEYAKTQGWHVAGTFRDRGMSGSDAKRPGLWEAVEALKPGYVLLVTKLDRLARDVYLSIYIERAVKKKQARIVSIRGEGTEGETPEDQLIRTIMQVFDEYARKANAARTSAAMKAHQQNGRRMSSKPPFGMMIDPSDPKRLVESVSEQCAIHRVIELKQHNKLGNREIARTMDAQGFPCRGALWNHGQVAAILKREGAKT